MHVFLMYFDFFLSKMFLCVCVYYYDYLFIYLYVFYNIMLDIGERATELMFPV